MSQSAAEILAQETAALRSTLNPLALLTPTNYLAERQKWLDGGRKFINPKFTYDLGAIHNAINQIEKILSNVDQIQTYFHEVADMPSDLIYHSLDLRCQELYYLAIFFQTIIAHQGIPGDHCERPLTELYGNLKASDIDLAKAMIGKNPAIAISKKYVDDPNLPKPFRQKSARFFRENLNCFQSIFSEAEKAKLKSLTFDANGIAQYFQIALNYMREHAHFGARMEIEERNSPAYQIDINPQYTAVCALAFSASGKSLIGIPADRKVNGLKLVELIGHELNSHYRSAMSTRNFFRNILEYRGRSDLVSLVPLLSHSLNETLSEGLAKLSDTQILGLSGLPKPYPVLAIDFIKQGHNFQETMEYVYDLSLQNHQSDDAALNNAWKITYRLFRGQTDTSSHCGYAFIKDKCHLCGFTEVINEISMANKSPIETVEEVLCYSALTAHEIQIVEEYEKQHSNTMFNNPYRLLPSLADTRVHAFPGTVVRNPAIYVAELLL